MIIYRFDGSMDGLLTAVFDSFVRKESPELLLGPEGEMPLFYDTLHEVVTDGEKSQRVWRKLSKSISRGACAALTAAFLTDNPGFPLLALRFVSRAVTTQPSIEGDFSDPAVLAVVREARRVRGEAHRLLQFVRFQKASDGTYFSMVEPLFDVLPFAVKHFEDRFLTSRSSFMTVSATMAITIRRVNCGESRWRVRAIIFRPDDSLTR